MPGRNGKLGHSGPPAAVVEVEPARMADRFDGAADHGREVLRAALEYAKRSWSVLPVHGVVGGRCGCGKPKCPRPGKRPVGKLAPKGHEDASVDPARIRDFFPQGEVHNVAIATGQRSGLLVLDIDPPRGGDESLRMLMQRFGEIPKTIEARSGGGGRHIYFRAPPGPVKGRMSVTVGGVTYKGIEIKGDGNYVVAPPSRHITGRVYTWDEGCGPDDVELADAPAYLLNLGKGHAASLPDSTGHSLSATLPGQTVSKSGWGAGEGEGSGVVQISEAMEQAIRENTPPGAGYRNAYLLKLVSKLKALLPDARPNQLTQVLRLWFDRAKVNGVRGTWDQTRIEFANAWKGSKGDTLKRAIAVAKSIQLPQRAIEAYDSDEMRNTIALCLALQRHEGPGNDFFLSCRSLGDAIGVKRTSAAGFLKLLKDDGVLIQVRAATMGAGGEAARFQMPLAFRDSDVVQSETESQGIAEADDKPRGE